MIRTLRVASVLVASLLAAACSSDKPKPTPLENITPQIAGQLVWRASVDGGLPFLLMPTARADSFVVAGGDGSVSALSVQDGREVWKANVGAT